MVVTFHMLVPGVPLSVVLIQRDGPRKISIGLGRIYLEVFTHYDCYSGISQARI
jgi:hypothetical protein